MDDCGRKSEQTWLSGTGSNGNGCSVGCFEGLVNSAVLINSPGCFVPVLQRGVEGTSVGHRSDGVLDLGVQSFRNFSTVVFGSVYPASTIKSTNSSK